MPTATTTGARVTGPRSTSSAPVTIAHSGESATTQAPFEASAGRTQSTPTPRTTSTAPHRAKATPVTTAPTSIPLRPRAAAATATPSGTTNSAARTAARSHAVPAMSGGPVRARRSAAVPRARTRARTAVTAPTPTARGSDGHPCRVVIQVPDAGPTQAARGTSQSTAVDHSSTRSIPPPTTTAIVSVATRPTRGRHRRAAGW